MKLNKIFLACMLLFSVSIIIPINDVYSQESENLQVEIKYTNGDRADFYGMSLVVYQDQDKTPILQKELEGNPEFITLPINHKYKVEIYANGMYADVGYIQLENMQNKLDINIPLSGGLQFNVFFEDGKTPIQGATVIIKSHDGTEWRSGKTNEQGDTVRYWIQSTTRQSDYYIAEVYLGNIPLITVSQIKLQPGLAQNQKIVVPIPDIPQDLITVSLFKTTTQKVVPDDGNFSVLMKDMQDQIIKESPVNSRGEAYFSNIPSGEYTIIVHNELTKDLFWQEIGIIITGEQNDFEIFKNKEINIEEKLQDSESILSCNCVAFRLDDVQDYWLNKVQIAVVETFTERDIPLTVGIVSDSFGNDSTITNFIKDALSESKLDIASQGIGTTPFTEFDKQEQSDLLKQSVDKIYETLNVHTKIFVPPQNRFNDDTKQALLDNKFTHISASTLHGDSPPFPLEGELLYRFPEIATTGIFDPEYNIFVGISSNKTFSDTLNGLEEYGFAVITSHPQEFSLVKGGTYTNEVNTNQINELKTLIQKIKDENIQIVLIREINLDSDVSIPNWIKNNAGWWAKDAIDDKTFVQGIQYLINEEIMNIPQTESGEPSGNNIPSWIKNNAGWWADGLISDKDFIKGIEFLVKSGIITY